MAYWRASAFPKPWLAFVDCAIATALAIWAHATSPKTCVTRAFGEFTETRSAAMGQSFICFLNARGGFFSVAPRVTPALLPFYREGAVGSKDMIAAIRCVALVYDSCCCFFAIFLAEITSFLFQ
ncbi:hypothetical protein EHM76_01595 [bacterium]|nr:MAG: hypothetical protein EHM76_01595 [bacterium]